MSCGALSKYGGQASARDPSTEDDTLLFKIFMDYYTLNLSLHLNGRLIQCLCHVFNTILITGGFKVKGFFKLG